MTDTKKTQMQNGRQMRFTDSELSLIKNTFKDNVELLKLMRKVFLPEIDPDAPLGQLVDLWCSLPIKEMTPDQAQINILARNSLIMHVDQQLIQLQVLADTEDLTVEEIIKRNNQNSAK